MKRMIMAALAALVIAGTASAQNVNPPSAPNKGTDREQLQLVTISGKLEWIDGTIGLKSGGNVYFTPRVRELVGFVKDLQEGATVSLTGYAQKVPFGASSFFFMSTKLTFNGKDYEFAQNGGLRGRGPGMMGMRDRNDRNDSDKGNRGEEERPCW
jgi:hypothetical protein